MWALIQNNLRIHHRYCPYVTLTLIQNSRCAQKLCSHRCPISGDRDFGSRSITRFKQRAFVQGLHILLPNIPEKNKPCTYIFNYRIVVINRYNLHSNLTHPLHSYHAIDHRPRRSITVRADLDRTPHRAPTAGMDRVPRTTQYLPCSPRSCPSHHTVPAVQP